MADLLLELLSEEIPARMQARARADLQRMMAEALQGAALGHGVITCYSTPRRLSLIIRDVAGETEAASEELKGPRTSAPPQALEGFLRKTGLGQDRLEDRGGIWFAVIDRPGRSAGQVIAEAVSAIIADFPWPKSMRWGPQSSSDASLRWVRPLHSIVALLGEEIVPVEVAGVVSGATTLGHRFHHPGPITIGGAGDYVEKLRACRVLVDHEEREALIRDGAAKAAKAADFTLIEDEGLVVENAGLTEWPVPLAGEFDPDFLDVPREVIVLTMRTNQKYFACSGSDGGLAPGFVCIANIEANDGGLAIVEGNRRVLAARLADARFFWEQDLKMPLEEQAKKLSGIVLHEKLGTVGDRGRRFDALAVDLSRYFGADLPNARRAALLAKADLVTGMVGEFPELQGVIGGHLARAQGEPDAVVDAIRDHYRPLGQSDDVPSAPATVAVAIAEKLDTLVGFFGIGQPPTGSKDPFALRRAALGAIRLITENGLRIRLLELFPGAAQLYRNTGLDVRDSGTDLLDFFADRLKVQQRAAGVGHDLIDAVFALGGEDDLVRLLARVKALQAFVETDEGRDLNAGYKRAANILKKEEGSWTSDQVRGDDIPGEEAALTKALDAAEPKATAAIDKEDFTAAMAALASLRAPIDAFFDQVKVKADDPGTRARRLNLLARFRDAVNQVADFSKIEG